MLRKNAILASIDYRKLVFFKNIKLGIGLYTSKVYVKRICSRFNIVTLWVLSDASMHNKCRALSSVTFFCNNCQAHMNNRSCKCGNMHNLQQLDGCKKAYDNRKWKCWIWHNGKSWIHTYILSLKTSLTQHWLAL